MINHNLYSKQVAQTYGWYQCAHLVKKMLTNHPLHCLRHIDKQFELQTSSIKKMADANVRILSKHFDKSLISS